MSAAVDAIFAQSVEQIHAAGFRRTFRILSGAGQGSCFDGTLVQDTFIDPDAPLGQDVRERSRLDVPYPAPPLKIGDRVQESNDTVVWRILARVDNPADVEVSFSVSKVVPGKDAA